MPPKNNPPINLPGNNPGAPLGEANVDFQSAAVGVLPGVDANTAANPQAGFGCLISSLLSISMAIAALMLLLYLIMGGIQWISSEGDKGKIEKARGRITSAIMGIIILSASVAILTFVQNFLGISTLNFGGSNSCAAGGSPSSPGGSPGGNNPGTCTVGTTANDGGAGGYCSQGAAIVRCNAADNHLSYPHYDPCSCVNGAIYQVAGYDFGSC